MTSCAIKTCAILVAALGLAGCGLSEKAVDLVGALSPQSGADIPAESQPTDLDGALRLARSQREKRDLQGATRTLSQLVLFAPDDPRVLGEYGKTLVADGRSDDAIAFLRQAVIRQSDDWTLFSALGVAYDQKGDHDAARTFYARAMALKPNDATVLNNSALSRLLAGDLDHAEALLLRASRDNADSPKITHNLELVRSLKASEQRRSPPVQDAAPDAAPAARVAVAKPAPTESAPVSVAALADALPAAAAKPTRRPPVKLVPPRAAAARAPSPKRASANVTAAIYVQAGAYASKENANRMASKLGNLGARVLDGGTDGHTLFRVRIGPFQNAVQADIAREQVHALGQDDVRIVSE